MKDEGRGVQANQDEPKVSIPKAATAQRTAESTMPRAVPNIRVVLVPWCLGGEICLGWIPELLFSEADVILRDPTVVALVPRHSTGRVDASPREPGPNSEGES